MLTVFALSISRVIDTVETLTLPNEGCGGCLFFNIELLGP
jgi:hypothetical protein